MDMDYRNKAINCLKNTALPVLRAQFEECGCDLDAQYTKYGNTEFFFAEIVEGGHVYELGYQQCFCEEVLRGQVSDVAHCECSRQGILYVMQELVPNKSVTVTTIETVLGGAKKCRFRVTVA